MLTKTTFTFFKDSLTYMNSKRITLNLRKNYVNYRINSPLFPRRLSTLYSSLSILSFTLYYLRFSINLTLLCTQTTPAEQQTLLYGLFNDLMWGSCNLAQIMWLTFKRSKCRGLRGLQLESLCQLVDFIMLLHHQNGVLTHQQQLLQRDWLDATQQYLANELFFIKLQMLRTIIAVLAIMLTFSAFAFSLTSVSITPLLYGMSVSNALTRSLINIINDKQRIQNLRQSIPNQAEWVNQQQQALWVERAKEIMQIVIDYVVVPLSLYLVFCTMSYLGLAAVLLFDLTVNVLCNAWLSPPANQSECMTRMSIALMT